MAFAVFSQGAEFYSAESPKALIAILRIQRKCLSSKKVWKMPLHLLILEEKKIF